VRSAAPKQLNQRIAQTANQKQRRTLSLDNQKNITDNSIADDVSFMILINESANHETNDIKNFYRLCPPVECLDTQFAKQTI